MKVKAASCVVVSLVVFLAVTAAAKGELSLCAAYAANGACQVPASYTYGDTVYLRGGSVRSEPGLSAGVWRRDPHERTWHRVGSAPVRPNGAIRWKWRTDREDAVQDAPYRFQLRLPGPSRSNAVRAWVLFGE